MTPRETEEQFVERWRSWLDRPTRRSPQAAAATVVSLLGRRRGSARTLWAIAAGAAATAMIAGLLWRAPRDVPTPPEGPATLVAPYSESLQPGEVLIMIDDQTPLYMNFQPPGSEGAPKS